MKNDTFNDDISRIIKALDLYRDRFKNAVILITGATGHIGTALIHALSALDSLDLKIIAHGRDALKIDRLCARYRINSITGDIREPIPPEKLPSELDYIIHAAGITKSREMITNPVDVITTAIDGTRNILELAHVKRAKSVVYLSSMEVYGRMYRSAESCANPVHTEGRSRIQAACLHEREVTERDLGFIDLSDPRSCYPESKRMCENLCVCYNLQYGVPVKIARLAQSFGAGTPKDDTRVFAQFARSVINKNPIILHTEGISRGNYCYLADTVHALLTLLLNGSDGEAYNISSTSATIREMADMLADKYGLSVIIDKDKEGGYAPDTNIRLNADKIQKLGWRPRYSLIEMYERLIADWDNEET